MMSRCDRGVTYSVSHAVTSHEVTRPRVTPMSQVSATRDCHRCPRYALPDPTRPLLKNSHILKMSSPWFAIPEQRNDDIR